MAAESEAKGAINDSRKRKRRYLPHNRPVKKKGPSPLRPGVVGFFITCDGGRETQASHEALDVIDSFFEDLIDGKSSNTGVATIPKKPKNKKIKFSYSESSESEGGDDNGDESDEEESKLEKTVNVYCLHSTDEPFFSKLILKLQLAPQEFVTGLSIFSCMPTTLNGGVALTQLVGGNAALALCLTVTFVLLGMLTEF